MQTKSHYLSFSQTQSANSSATRRYDSQTVNQLRKSNQGLQGDYDEPAFLLPETALVEDCQVRDRIQSPARYFNQDSGIFLIQVTFGKHSEEKILRFKESILRDLLVVGELRVQSSSFCIAEYLPEVKKKLLLIELDGVLIPKIRFPFEQKPQLDQDQQIVLRPHYQRFLMELSQCYTICVFTKLSDKMAQTITNLIDPNREFISAVLSKQSCTQAGKRLIKNLKIIKNYKRKDTVVIESSLRDVYDHLDNTLPFIPWEADDEQDVELSESISFLQKLSLQNDVRNHLIKRYQLTKFAMC